MTSIKMPLHRRTLALACLALALLTAPVAQAQLYESPAPVRDSARSFSQHVVSWKDMKREYVVMQERDYSCGAAALATVMRYYWGDNITEAALLRQVERTLKPAEILDRVRRGFTLTDLRRLAVQRKYDATIGRLSLAELAAAKVPVVVAIRLNGLDHFVVVRGIVDGQVYLADPTRGNLRVPINVFSEQWVESALLVIAKPDQEQSDVSVLGVTQAEVDFPWLNRQLIRTQPEKTFLRP